MYHISIVNNGGFIPPLFFLEATMSIKGKILRTIGWTTVGIGLYFVYLGNEADGIKSSYNRRNMKDIIEAEFTVLDD